MMPNDQSGKRTSPRNSTTVLLSSIQATTAALDNGGLKAASSHWLVEDLQPASLIPVDDTPVASGTVTPFTTLSPIKNKTGSTTVSAGVLIRSQDLDPDDKDFLASLTTQLEADDESESQVLITPAFSVQKREDSDEEDEGDGSEPDERVLRVLEESGFGIGFAMDKNRRYRRTMEDTHCYFYDFDDTPGSGFFAIFDGHAGVAAADYCQTALPETFARLLKERPSDPIPELLNQTFLQVDTQMAQKKEVSAGTTAIVAYMRFEEREVAGDESEDSKTRTGTKKMQRQRVLYTANVGDARAVLCRDSTAVRLSYDHKGSDPSESLRVQQKGGFMFNSRVNGILAVTRSLGDQSMKEWVIGNPYTTETLLTPSDDHLILACDGVWDVCSDQCAVELVKKSSGGNNPQKAAQTLLEYSLENLSTDNLSILVVKLNPSFCSLVTGV